MPKRRAEEKLAHYQRKIRKIQNKVMKSLRVIQYSDSSDGEPDIEGHEPFEMEDASDHLAERPDAQLEPTVPPPSLPPSPAPETIIDREETEAQDTPASSSEQLEQPLDPEILSALGSGMADTPDFGDPIHNNLAIIWPPLLRKGLSKEDKEKINKEYLIPSNCKLLQAPKLNAEISAAVSEIVRGRDKKLKNFQQELGVSISAINRGMDSLIKNDNKLVALKNFSDGCRLLSHLHHSFTKDRIKLIIPSLEKNFLHVIHETERDDTLFGNTLGDKIKASKAIERQGNQIRNKTNRKPTPQTSVIRPVQQGNWNGPPRFPLNRGGRGGRGRAASTVARRPYQSSSAPPAASKNSGQPKPYANNVQQ